MFNFKFIFLMDKLYKVLALGGAAFFYMGVI